jgi:hypothetical protein
MAERLFAAREWRLAMATELSLHSVNTHVKSMFPWKHMRSFDRSD